MMDYEYLCSYVVCAFSGMLVSSVCLVRSGFLEFFLNIIVLMVDL
jgi:hypothetical protein